MRTIVTVLVSSFVTGLLAGCPASDQPSDESETEGGTDTNHGQQLDDDQWQLCEDYADALVVCAVESFAAARDECLIALDEVQASTPCCEDATEAVYACLQLQSCEQLIFDTGCLDERDTKTSTCAPDFVCP